MHVCIARWGLTHPLPLYLCTCTGCTLRCCLRASSTQCSFKYAPGLCPIVPVIRVLHLHLDWPRHCLLNVCRVWLCLWVGVQRAIVRLAPTLHARRGLWSSGFMRVLKIDEFTENDQKLFTQPLVLARLGRYLIEMHRVRAIASQHAVFAWCSPARHQPLDADASVQRSPCCD